MRRARPPGWRSSSASSNAQRPGKKLLHDRHLSGGGRRSIVASGGPQMFRGRRRPISMTKIMRRALIGASTLAFVTLAATPAAAQRVERIVAMGDSLADTGNALQLLLASPLVPPATKAQLLQLYPSGRFSGGTNYIDSLSLLLNAPVINYAVG